MGPSVPSRIGVVCLLIAASVLAPRPAAAVTFDGDITYTSDYVFRGISETAGRSAGQIDLHLTTNGGTFLGVFASTLGRVWHVPDYGDLGWDYALEEYLGHRFDLSPAWSATVTAVNYSYLGGNAPLSNDYQELSAAVSYLDSWTVTVAADAECCALRSGLPTGALPRVHAGCLGPATHRRPAFCDGRCGLLHLGQHWICAMEMPVWPLNSRA